MDPFVKFFLFSVFGYAGLAIFMYFISKYMVNPCPIIPPKETVEICRDQKRLLQQDYNNGGFDLDVYEVCVNNSHVTTPTNHCRNIDYSGDIY